MAPFLLEPSSLEVEPLEVVSNVPEPERSLENLTATSGKVDIDVALMANGIIPVNTECASEGSCGFCVYIYSGLQED